MPNSAAELGFTTYVYKRRRPFSQQRLFQLVQRWPLPSKTLRISGDEASFESEPLPPGKDPIFKNVLRSKGTAWLDGERRLDQHATVRILDDDVHAPVPATAPPVAHTVRLVSDSPTEMVKAASRSV